MKTILLLITHFFFLLFFTGCDFYERFTPSAENIYQLHEFDLVKPASLHINTTGGRIVVTGSDTNKLSIMVFVQKKGQYLQPSDSLLNQEFLSKYKIEITRENNQFSAIAKKTAPYNTIKWDGYSISFLVTAPKALACDLQTSGGGISLETLDGKQNVSTCGGRLSFRGVNGDISGQTSGGQIDAEQCKGKLDIRTSGGGIRMLGIKGDITAHTSGGTIQAKNCHGDINVSSSGGGIDLKEISGSVKAKTSGGGVHVEMIGLEKWLELKTSGGNVDAIIPYGLGLDLDLKGNYVKADLENFDGKTEKDHVKGRVNSGGIPVNIKTSGGAVALRFKEQSN